MQSNTLFYLRLIVANLFALIASVAFQRNATTWFPPDGHYNPRRTLTAIAVTLTAFLVGFLFACMLSSHQTLQGKCAMCGARTDGVKCPACGAYPPLRSGGCLIGLILLLLVSLGAILQGVKLVSSVFPKQ